MIEVHHMVHPWVPRNKALTVRHQPSQEVFLYTGKPISQEQVDEIISTFLSREMEYWIDNCHTQMKHHIYEHDLSDEGFYKKVS